MSFYESIADQYDYIFPADDVQVDFVTTSIPKPHDGKAILDIGCGTGSLAIALGRRGFRVTAIDLDAAMITKAVEKGREEPAVTFRQLDMRTIGTTFAPASFDAASSFDAALSFNAVLCFGNTLVHLKERDDVLSVLKAARTLLAPEGRVLLQILNYDMILAKRPPGLPTIENDHIRFERGYLYNDDGSITFRTVLTVKASERLIANDAFLYPLRKGDLETMLKESGFSDLRFHGSFRRVPLSPETLPLVVEAR
jgi:glycine/sarcosine N-methyltransferase